MPRTAEHSTQGFRQEVAVSTAALRRNQRTFSISTEALRWCGIVFIAIPPFLLFGKAPVEISFLFSIFGFLASISCAFAGVLRRGGARLPLRLPASAECRDPGDPAPDGKPRKARGNIYMGRDRETKEELWLSQDDMLRHMLVLGTTGAGKTATLIGIASNLLCSGGGLIYSDAKGSTELYYQIHGLARRLGRDDDVLIMNYQTSSSQNNIREKRSNSLNLFLGRSADTLSQIFLSLMPGGGGDGANAVFSAKAEALMSATLTPLVWLRDNANWTLSLRMLADAMTWDGATGLASIDIIPDSHIRQLRDFVESQPGMPAKFREDGAPPKVPAPQWKRALREASATTLETRKLTEGGSVLKRESGWSPSDQTLQQFGYAGMYHTRALQSLSETYGDLYDVVYGDIKLEDVIAQRRILVVVLPALEKSPTELRQLGKLLLSAIRGAVALGLGQAAEGSRAEAIDRSPTRSESIALIIADEYAFQLAEGFATVAAQARSLSVGVIFAGQDLAGIKKAGAEEADQVVANTLTKIIMRLAETEHTAKLAIDLGGEIYVPMATGGDTKAAGVEPTTQAQYQKVRQVDTKDLQAQTEGQGHIFFGERVVRGSLFYPGNLTSDHLYIRRFVPVPGKADLAAFRAR